MDEQNFSFLQVMTYFNSQILITFLKDYMVGTDYTSSKKIISKGRCSHREGIPPGSHKCQDVQNGQITFHQ